MNLWKALWIDESGMIVSAEAALLGTVGVVAATVGLTAAGRSINDELKDVAFSIRSLDQSYSFEGHRSPHAWTAGSSFTQAPVEESLKQLQQQIDEQERQLQKQTDEGEQEQEAPEPEEERGKKRKRRGQEAEHQPFDPSWKMDGVAASDI
ncbi:hypothetical protein SH661x_002386 [Planctomicrobium sp. SH661]|uniref:hypothetical protein n=1 Tax=Planctomicrobium sp. SH661 TaxID=3448124 RepID=UPI003F5C7F9B